MKTLAAGLLLVLFGASGSLVGVRVPDLHGDRTTVQELLRKGLACWAGDAQAWTYDDTVLFVLKVPDPVRNEQVVGQRNLFPPGIALWCFWQGDGKPPAELRDRVKATRFILVLKNTDTMECRMNEIAGAQVVDGEWTDQQRTAKSVACASIGDKLAGLRVPAVHVKSITEYLDRTEQTGK